MQRGELGRAERRFRRHEIFPEEIGVLYHCALERLKNHATFLQVFGDDVAFDQLIVREDHACGIFIEATRIFQNILAVVFRKRRTDFERRQIEKRDISKSPGLIFPGRRRQLFELLPRFALLIMEPIWKLTQLGWAGENRGGLLLICDYRHVDCISEPEPRSQTAATEIGWAENYPTEPSISSSINRLSSTQYSIGNWRTRSLTKPLTLRLMACASVKPRCCIYKICSALTWLTLASCWTALPVPRTVIAG